MRIPVTLVALIAVATAACGGAAPTTADPAVGGQSSAGTQGGASAGAGQSGGTAPDAGAIEPEPAGPVEPNTIRIGSQVLERTLPMTTGQCFLFEEDGTYPTWGAVSGSLDGNEDLRFSAKVSQDGTFSAVVNDNTSDPTMAGPSWYAGEGSGLTDLVVELNLDTQTISGHGTFKSAGYGKLASGSFEFICEE